MRPCINFDDVTLTPVDKTTQKYDSKRKKYVDLKKSTKNKFNELIKQRLGNKYNKNETKIDKLVGKYTYIKKVKVKNPYYDPSVSRYEPA